MQAEVRVRVYTTPENIKGKIKSWDLVEHYTYREVSTVFVSDLK